MKNVLALLLLSATVILASCQKDQSTIPVSEVTINKKAIALTIGEKEALTVTVLPNNATDKDVTWTSSDTLVAKVSANGEVSAVSAGTAIITVVAVDDKTKTATCEVTVTISGVTLNKKTLSLPIGEKEILIATVSSNGVTNKSVTWTSSDTLVAKVSANGEVEGISAGIATITVATINDKSKTDICKVTITKSRVDIGQVTLNKKTLSLPIGEKETLITTVLPDEATNKDVTWTSSNESVATVSATGEVNAISAGTTKITVAAVDDKTKAATCEVTVIKPDIAVGGVSLNKKTFSLLIGTKETLIAKVSPDEATNKNVTWASSNTSVATVSTTGEVNAISAGTATITVVSVDDKTKVATCEVTVIKPDIAVGGVSLNKKTLPLLIGTKETLIATVFPNEATDKNVTWTSSNTSVATVSTTGEVSAVGTGTTTITIVSVNDKAKTDACTVTVTAPISTTTAAIGHFYYDDASMTSIYDRTKKCIGIVFWVDPQNNQKGKIVSLDEQELEWSVKTEESTGATNNSNGPSNMREISKFFWLISTKSHWEDYPAFYWVATKKNGRLVGGWDEKDMWYLPAQGDLVDLFGKGGATMTAVNKSLNSMGTVALTTGLYCSSTEKDAAHATFVSLSTGFSQSLFKFSANKVRAVAAF